MTAFISEFTSSLADSVFAFTPTGDALTVTLGAGQAEIHDDSTELFGVYTTSVALPVTDDGALALHISLSGYSFIPPGVSGYSVLSANGQTSVKIFNPELDEDFVQELAFSESPARPVVLSVFLLIERPEASADAVGLIRPVSIDAEVITPEAS